MTSVFDLKLKLGHHAVPATSNFRGATRLSDLLHSWTMDVVKEYGLSSDNVLFSVSDSGSEVRRDLGKVQCTAA